MHLPGAGSVISWLSQVLVLSCNLAVFTRTTKCDLRQLSGLHWCCCVLKAVSIYWTIEVSLTASFCYSITLHNVILCIYIEVRFYGITDKSWRKLEILQKMNPSVNRMQLVNSFARKWLVYYKPLNIHLHFWVVLLFFFNFWKILNLLFLHLNNPWSVTTKLNVFEDQPGVRVFLLNGP